MSILPQLIANSLIASALVLLVALGFNLIFGATKFFNLAHGSMAVIGAYAFYFLFNLSGWNFWMTIIISIAIAGLAGWLSDRLLFRQLRLRKATSMVQLVASLGLFTVIQALLAIAFSSQFQILSNAEVTNKTRMIFGAAITDVQLVAICSAIVCSLLLALALKYSRFGKSVRAISDDEEVSKIIGLNTDRIIGWVFFVGSALAGIAGLFFGLDTGIEPIMGLPILLGGIIACIIGGRGSVGGAVLGSLLVGFVENFGIWHLDGEWKSAILFGLLILFLIFRPQGILKK